MMLEGRVCVVTGAASARGIGKATARLLAGHGARVALLDLSADAVGAAATDIESAPGDPSPIGLACDVTDRAACDTAMHAVAQAFGGIDAVIANAGITQPVGLMEIGPDDYQRITDVSLRGTLYTAQAAVPHLRARGGGSIVCMSSVSAERGGGIFGGPHYSAAKAGVIGLARAMARELGPDGIRVNAVAPGLVETDITAGKLSDAMRRTIEGNVPLGRLGAPDDVAGVCLFLVSPLSAYMTGAVLDVNGGMHIG